MTNEYKPNPDVPPRVADSFVAFARGHGFALDYSQASLNDTLDKILDLPLVRSDVTIAARIQDLDLEFDIASAASAYLGETLVRLYDGAWTGHFAQHSGVNFYTSRISFGDYILEPSVWLSYRISNGREEGAVADWHSRVFPSIEARRDLTPGTGFIRDIY